MGYCVRSMRREFFTERRLFARERSARWRAVRDAPRYEPLPWEVADFGITRAPNVVLIHPPGLDAGPMRSGLTRAYREVERKLPRRDLPPRVFVVAARDGAQTERLTGVSSSSVLALASVRLVEWPNGALGVERKFTQRMLVVASRWSALDATERRSTLVHEMTHTAMEPHASYRTPAWLVEGMAMFVAREDLSAAARARAAGGGRAMPLARISGRDSILRLRGSASDAAYAAASAAAHAIVAEHGRRGLFELFDAFNDSRIPGGQGARTTDRVRRRTLGMSLAELDAAVAGG